MGQASESSAARREICMLQPLGMLVRVGERRSDAFAAASYETAVLMCGPSQGRCCALDRYPAHLGASGKSMPRALAASARSSSRVSS